MDLRKLLHATTLASERNFARAATRLHITQSALSQSIARLEAETGFALFERGRGGARPTSAGKTFLARAESLLQHARGLEHEASLMRNCSMGSVSFGFGPIPADMMLTEVLSMLAREYPGLIVEAKINDTLDLLEDLLCERTEFFVAATTALQHEHRIDIRPLVTTSLGFFVRAGHPLVVKRALSMRDLRAYPLLSLYIAESDRTVAKKLLKCSAADPWPPTVFCDDLHVLRRLALDSDGILLGPEKAVITGSAGDTLKKLRIKDQPRPVPARISIVTLSNRTLSPVAAMVIERLRQLAPEYGVRPQA